MYITQNTQAEQLRAVEKFKFEDSAVAFQWRCSTENVLDVIDLDDDSADHFRNGDFAVLHTLDVDVELLKKIFKDTTVYLTDHLDNHLITLHELV